jgi:hypothetical protein
MIESPNIAQHQLEYRHTIDDDFPNLTQNTVYEWNIGQINGEPIVCHDRPEGTTDCYSVKNLTRNVRAVATADAVIYNGMITQWEYDEEYGTIRLYHSWAGFIEGFFPREWFASPVLTLSEVPMDIGLSGSNIKPLLADYLRPAVYDGDR